MRLTLTLLVVAAAVSLSAQAPDRSKPPVSGPPPALKVPTIQKQQLSNGLPVWVVEQHEVPVAQVNLVVLSGSADDPSGKYGVASLAASMLMEGAGSRSALELADAIDFLGADLTTGSASDLSAVRLHAPVARLADALPIMADVAQRPLFAQPDLDRLRQQRLTSIVQARDDPNTIAALAYARVLYGSAHRFGTATMGTADTLRGFTTADLRAFYAAAFRPDNATLIVVGDVAPATVVPLLEKSFGGWTRPAGAALAHVKQPLPPARARREVYLVDKAGAPQSQVRIGLVGVPRSTPDYFPIQVMNTIFGGSFSSRLNLNLREKHGYTYGANSFFDMRLEPGPFTAFAGVQTDKTAESLKEFFNEFAGIVQPVPADELDRAKNYVALGLPGDFETTGDISRRLEDALVYRLPDDYFSRYVQNIEAVTAADVQRVARAYLQADRLAVVIVGDRAVIEPGVRALNLGPITVLTIDQIFGPPPAAR
ncbi:MAG TPA: pitrilysin family protein [Vicinamibacterales bacterium]|nr:pitrilysin family protein [Vicinamibacterales bacterium]